MRVVITRAAFTDLVAIADWIDAEQPDRAPGFIDALHERCTALGKFPLAYPLVPRFEAHGIRRRVFRDHLIFYRIRASRVEVLRVLHGARDYATLLSLDF
ncbi:plasmid stabilization system protein ParE [Nitrospirillum amazonense]|uniref:Plasmid stabilization system protein ParE n=1 Tax=Nitrospirillum amazonense TaxID=28077 RepID=A0A560FST0_9PROT|nr:type II toxin-antitoxin system RelE/ParE family toxin [Nitrospirillum amazonense]TWB24694.1 plasmid stabilization system protein ParE [Nitrospirillum amazonense]